MNPAKKALATSVNFVRNHQLPIAVAATAVTTAVIVKKTMDNQLTAALDFMKKEGILDEFFASVEESI
jgi:hypothetical protein